MLEILNPRSLNAEDDTTLALAEAAADLVLLDPEIEIGWSAAGSSTTRATPAAIFGAGINLTGLYRGQIDFLFYLARDLGFLNKVYRVCIIDGDPERDVEKLWIAAVEIYAIGGACQLLHVVDHVIAGRGPAYLPARKEGIIPGVSNLRLPRSVGDRAARQAILSGREWTPVKPTPTCSSTRSSSRRRWTRRSWPASGARGLRPGQRGRQPQGAARRRGAAGHLSPVLRRLRSRTGRVPPLPALVRNLERHWNAAERKP